MGIEQKGFAGGGMDFDSSKNYVAPNDYAAAYNVRNSGNADAEEGEISNIESNEIIAGTRATGINKAIGACGFERTGYGYSWIFNSAGYHQLIEIGNEDETETVIFTNITDTGGVNSLPMDPDFYFNDFRLINGYLLAFTNNDLEPCCINLDRLKAGTLGVLTVDDFKLIKKQPLILPTAVYGDDTGRSTNQLRGKLFQFAYYNTYLDNEDSAMSSHSKRIVPEQESTPAVGTDVTQDNNIIVTVDAGDDRVKTLNIASQIGGETTWFLIKSIERSDVITITDTAVDVNQQVYEAYDPATNLFSFAFYNDGNYPNLDELFTDLDYDHVPKKAGALEVVNGSILTLADITEGEERPVIDAMISVSAFEPNIAVEQPDPTNDLKVTFTETRRISGSKNRWITVTFGGIAKTGDEMTIQIYDREAPATTFTYTYTVPIAENNNTAAAVASFAAQIPNSSVQGGNSIVFKTDDLILGYAKIDLQNAGTGVSRSISSLKTNSSYQLALAHYDKYGRYFPIATNDNLIVKTQSYAQTFGQIPKITWAINNDPPEGAVSAQWLLTKNNTHETTLYITAKLDATASDADYLTFNINPLLEFNEKNSSSILNYEYSAGDRCTFQKMIDGATTMWFNSPPVDVEVVDFEIDVDETDTSIVNYILKVRKSAAITEADITAKNILLEIYSPKKRMSVVDGENVLAPTLFYEIGERISITNGAYDTTSGEITQGDCYFKTRSLASGTDLESIASYQVEDFHFSDFYSSNYTSYGRARTYDDMKGEVYRPACIRYSDTFLEGSTLNGITRFFAERIYGDAPGQSSSNYGAINKIIQVDNTLVCIQDRKVGRIPVYISIIEDQAAQENVAVSDSLFGNIRYSESGNYGMGGCRESFAQRPDGTIYFTDPNNSLPIRVGRDGTKPIPGKMSKFFRRTLQAAKQAGLKIIGYYDVFNDEYVVAIHQIGDVVTQFAFSEANWRYLEDYIIDPDDMTITTSPTKGSVTFNPATGKDIYIPNSGTSGSDSYIYTFDVNGTPTTKRVCINITPADKTPNPFYFLDVTDADLSTVYTSNSILVSGINAPTDISISAGEFRINGTGTWYTSASTGITVVNEDTVEVRQTSSGSYDTATDITLTVGGVSDTYTVTTREAANVTVNYAMVFGSNPTTSNWNVIERTRNAVTTTIATIENVTTGTLAAGDFKEGDTITVYQGAYDAFEWSPDSKVNLNVSIDSVEYYDGDVTTQSGTQNTSYVIADGVSVIDIVSTGSSTALGYITESLHVENVLSVVGDLVVDVSDNSEAGLGLDELEPVLGASDYPFNVLGTTGTLTVVIRNTSALPFNYTLNGEGGYTHSGIVGAGADVTWTDVTKGGVEVITSIS